MVTQGSIFISYDIRDPLSERWALWTAATLRDERYPSVVLPQKSWALGYWTQFLQDSMVGAQRIVLILSPSYLTSTDPFVEWQRRFALRELLEPRPQLLVALVGECSTLLPDESVLFRTPWIDFREVLRAEESCHQHLLEGVKGQCSSQRQMAILEQ